MTVQRSKGPRIRELAVRFSRFSVVSAIGMGVQLIVITLFVAAGGNYMVATALGVTAAVVHNYIWHERWTFGRPNHRTLGPLDPWTVGLVRFFAANGVVSMIGNLLLMRALVGGMSVPPVAANVLAIAVCGLVNFWLANRVVFRPS